MEQRKSKRKLNPIVLEEATSWFIDFNEGQVDKTGQEEFTAWIRRSPENVQAYLQVANFWEDSSTLKWRAVDFDSLMAKASREENVFPLELAARANAPPGVDTEEGNAPRHSSRARWLALAATLVLGVGIAAVAWQGLFRHPSYAADVGEQRSLTLEDGSSVELNSRSRIRVHYTERSRDIELLEGQALFRVAKDPARPFTVKTDRTLVRAVGTEFDVYRKPTATVVTVIEGRVAVAESRQILEAGEQITISPAAAELPKPKPANLAVAQAWTEKKLIFESTPLREVVEEFNRYNRQQLVVRDAELYDFHVSGVFPSTDSTRMLEFLRQRFGVSVRQDGNEIEISRESGRVDPG